MSRATRLPVIAVMALGIAVAGRGVLAKKKPPVACAAGRWVLAAPLVAGQSTPATGAVEAAPGSVSIPGVCPPIAPKQFKAAAGGTKVKAKWPSCTRLTGKVTFAGTLKEACATLRGTVKAKRFKAKVRGQRAADYVATTIGAAGGRVVSTDGLLTLDVPPGALAADTAISIRRAGASELPASVDGAQVVYVLGPDGLIFQTPVTATFQLPPPRGPGGDLGVDFATLVTVGAEGGPPEPLGAQRVVVDGAANLASAVGTLTHFTLVVSDYGQKANVTATVPQGTTLDVGKPFDVVVTATFVGAADVTPNPQAVSYADSTPPGGVVQYGGPASVPMGTITKNRVPLTVRVPDYSCGPPGGKGPYAGVVQIDAFPPVNVGEEMKCGVTTTTTLRTTSTTRRTTTTSVTSTTATTRTTTTVTTTTSTSTTVTTTTSTSTTTSTTTTTTLPQINCCDCPQPRGCASGPRVFPGDCVEFGCTFVANAVCTTSGDCAAIVSTTTSTSSSTTTSTSTTSTSTSTSTSSSTSTIAPVPSTTTTTLQLVVIPIPVNAPEALWVVASAQFYRQIAQGRLAVLVAGANGWAIVDGATGAVLEGGYVTPFGSLLFVAAPLGWEPPLSLTAGVPRAAGDLPLQGVIQAGLSGPAISLFDVTAGQFGFTQIFPGNPACFDAVPNGNDPLSGEMVLACGARLQTLKPDATAKSFTSGPNYTGFTQTTGPAFSAFRRRAGGPVVAVTDGTPGKVMKHPATGTAGEIPQDIGAAGNSPRRIRCAPNGVCAVSNFASDNLTILTWDAQDNVVIVGPVAVGDGPVGIDIRPRTDGNVEVVSTGFNDNSYSITVLRANGSTVSNRKAAVPTGCTKPGHAVWGSGAQIIVTCNGSNAIAVIPNP